MLKFLLFFPHLLSVLFRCIKLAVVSCFYIYLEWLYRFFGGYLLAVLDNFFAQFVLPFLPIIFVEVDAWLSFFLFAVFCIYLFDFLL